jgi:hypothetical protein
MNTPNATTSCDPLRSRGEARRNRCYVSYWRITMKVLPPCIMAAILPIGYPLQSNWELFSAGAVPVRTTPGHSVATLRCAPEHLARALVLRGGNSMKKAPGSGPRSGERVGMDGAPDVLDEGMKTEVLGRFFYCISLVERGFLVLPAECANVRARRLARTRRLRCEWPLRQET